MKKRRQQQTWVILFGTATFVAMLLADLLKAAEVSAVYVIFLSIALSVGLSLIMTLELVIDRLARRKR